MQDYNKKLFQIKMTGLSFIVVALFMTNTPVMAKIPYLPTDKAWPKHVSLMNAVENIQKGYKENNEVKWVGAKSSNFDSILDKNKKFVTNRANKYRLQNIDSVSSSLIHFDINSIDSSSHKFITDEIKHSRTVKSTSDNLEYSSRISKKDRLKTKKITWEDLDDGVLFS